MSENKPVVENYGDDEHGAHERAAEHRADGKNSVVVVQGHDNGAGKWERDHLVVTREVESVARELRTKGQL